MTKKVYLTWSGKIDTKTCINCIKTVAYCINVSKTVAGKDAVTNYLFTYSLHHAAHKILVPQPGIKPVSPAVEAQTLNHWTTREAPEKFKVLLRDSHLEGS